MSDLLTPDELERLMTETSTFDWVGRANLIPVIFSRATLWVGRSRKNSRTFLCGDVPGVPEPMVQVFTTSGLADKWGSPDFESVAMSFLQVCELVMRGNLSGGTIRGRHDETFNFGPIEALYIYHGMWPAPLVPGERSTEPVLPEGWKGTIQPAEASWRWAAERAHTVLQRQVAVRAAYLLSAALNGRPPFHVIALARAEGTTMDQWHEVATGVIASLEKWPMIDGMLRPIFVWNLFDAIRNAVETRVPPFFVLRSENPALPKQ